MKSSCRRNRRKDRAHLPRYWLVEHFGRWIGSRRISQPVVRQFLDQGLSTCQCSGVRRNNRPWNRAALNHLLEMLGKNQKGVVFPRGWQGDLLRHYQEHLVNVRGLAPNTIREHMTYTLVMLDRLKVRRASQFMGWTPELIEKYVAKVGRFALLSQGIRTYERWHSVEIPKEIRYCEYGSKMKRTDLAQRCRQTCLSIDALLSAIKAKEKHHLLCAAAPYRKHSKTSKKQADPTANLRQTLHNSKVYIICIMLSST